MATNWTDDQRQIPVQLFDIMEQCEYHIACCDAPDDDRLSALNEIIEWCRDLRVVVQTGIPMADSDRFPARISSAHPSA